MPKKEEKERIEISEAAQTLTSFAASLCRAERAAATREKYLRDARAFVAWLASERRALSRESVLDYKQHLTRTMAAGSVNSVLSSLNAWLSYIGRQEWRVKSVRYQRALYRREERELSAAEYERLLAAAQRKGKERLALVMQTICATGIRVSELACVTVESLRHGRAEIDCKGKRRTVFLPQTLYKLLRAYAGKRGRTGGAVFVTRGGNPLDRSNIWAEMKALCREAGVAAGKVFPHNLRHLFARTYYTKYRDIVRLADLLGHSSINTTRIYTVESGETHRRQIEHLGLFLRC